MGVDRFLASLARDSDDHGVSDRLVRVGPGSATGGKDRRTDVTGNEMYTRVDSRIS